MTVPRPPLDRRAAIRIMHGAMVAGVLLLTAVFGFLLTSVHPGGLVPSLPGWLNVVGYALIVPVVVVTTIMGRRVEERAAAEDIDAWSVRHLGMLIVIWAVAEGGYLAGAVLWLLTGRHELLAVLGVFLLVLLLYRPTRYLGD
ncbi:MAG TPA: hypothetical protein VF890_04725 [Gemmatimonadales bacterium]